MFDLIKEGKIEVAFTNEISNEYEEQLGAFYSPLVANGIMQTLDTLENVHYIQVSYFWNLIEADPDDNKFSDCAIASRADYLITYDRHFRVLRQINFPLVTCLTIEEFKEILRVNLGMELR